MNTETFMYYSWPSLSSGEKALLSLIGRLNYSKKKLNDFDEDFEKKELLIMMDEFDLYLHPAWQQNIFNTLIQTLPKIFPGKNIQLILSSHSPIILSDLPNSNVQFLRKELLDKNDPFGSFKCKIEDNFQKLTFGSNIHTLFKESFFMSKGLIGQFAQDKIQNLIKFLNGELESTEEFNADTSLRLINKIGEPIIQNYLLDMWEKNFAKEFEYLSREELIRELRKSKIKELNNVANKNNEEN